MSTVSAWSVPADRSALAYAPTRGRVVMVGGGRQGVGVSTMAALFAMVAGGTEGEVLLVEAGGSGTAQRLFGALRPGTAASGSDTRDHLPIRVLPSLSVLSVPFGEPRAVARRIVQLRSHYAVTVVDAGSRLATATDVAAAGIDQLLCVSTPDGIASAGAYALIKALVTRLPDLPVGVLVNRAPYWAATEVDHHLRQAVSQFLRREIGPISHIPIDECLRAGVRAGMALHEIAVGSPAALALYDVAQSLQTTPSSLSQTVFSPRPLQRRS